MSVTRATSKGQVTIPVAVRRALGIEPGDAVSIRLDGDGRAVIVPQKGWAQRTAGMMKGYRPGPPPTAEELEDIIDGAWADAAVERDEASKRS